MFFLSFIFHGSYHTYYLFKVKVIGLAEPNIGDERFYSQLTNFLKGGLVDPGTVSHETYNHLHIFVSGDAIVDVAAWVMWDYRHSIEGIKVISDAFDIKYCEQWFPDQSRYDLVRVHDHRYLKVYGAGHMKAVCRGWIEGAPSAPGPYHPHDPTTHPHPWPGDKAKIYNQSIAAELLNSNIGNMP